MESCSVAAHVKPSSSSVNLNHAWSLESMTANIDIPKTTSGTIRRGIGMERVAADGERTPFDSSNSTC